MLKKIDHIRFWMINAEYNCRFFKKPLLGEPDDGTITTYDDIWEDTKKGGDFEYDDRMKIINNGFQRYIGEYYWDAPTIDKQGCDGVKYPGPEKQQRGVHYKMKRVTRKVMKAIRKINRRRLEPVRKNQQ